MLVKEFISQVNIKYLFGMQNTALCYSIDRGTAENLAIGEIMSSDYIMNAEIHDYDIGWFSYYYDVDLIIVKPLVQGPMKYIYKKVN